MRIQAIESYVDRVDGRWFEATLLNIAGGLQTGVDTVRCRLDVQFSYVLAIKLYICV